VALDSAGCFVVEDGEVVALVVRIEGREVRFDR